MERAKAHHPHPARPAAAEFERFGRMHRNTYINAPLIINGQFQAKTQPQLFFAGPDLGR